MAQEIQPDKHELKVTGGIGAFFYASIFWVLAVGFLAWIAVANDVIEFKHRRTLAERMNNRVGVQEPLINPVKVVIPARQGCFAVKRTYADGNRLTLYIHNSCGGSLSYHAWGWRAKAPDNTIIAQKYDNSLNPVPDASDIEKVIELPGDDRIATIEVWADGEK